MTKPLLSALEESIIHALVCADEARELLIAAYLSEILDIVRVART